ncbi:lysin motif receptor-like kinase (LysM-RLK) [Chara braunii]|uniref:Lysin motif receptor-like kinase (LysM-RLK) n=1 Tax=Chara braunii TaxID=69332 RepID=A0A388M5K6_CHABU|nr:lysin motif receptor-like kinase (LysM-RLK) [Chara braunii]|eukprot:GBG89826.1 lysin motif receptor-like kinase (LysM-RLK) [Chara braunii]
MWHGEEWCNVVSAAVCAHTIDLSMDLPLWFAGTNIEDRPEDDNMAVYQESTVICIAHAFRRAVQMGAHIDGDFISYDRLCRVADCFRLLFAACMWIMRMAGDDPRSHYKAFYLANLLAKPTLVASMHRPFDHRRSVVRAAKVVTERLGKVNATFGEYPDYIPEWEPYGIGFRHDMSITGPEYAKKLDWQEEKAGELYVAAMGEERADKSFIEKDSKKTTVSRGGIVERILLCPLSSSCPLPPLSSYPRSTSEHCAGMASPPQQQQPNRCAGMASPPPQQQQPKRCAGMASPPQQQPNRCAGKGSLRRQPDRCAGKASLQPHTPSPLHVPLLSFSQIVLLCSLFLTPPYIPIASGLRCQVDDQQSCTAFVVYRIQVGDSMRDICDRFRQYEGVVLVINNMTEATRLTVNRELIIPVSCSCNQSRSAQVYWARPTYPVQVDDTLEKIQNDLYQNLTAISDIVEVNRLGGQDYLMAGWTLRIPIPCACNTSDGGSFSSFVTYVPGSTGETADAIAAKFQTTVGNIRRASMIAEEEGVVDVYRPLIVPTNSVYSLFSGSGGGDWGRWSSGDGAAGGRPSSSSDYMTRHGSESAAYQSATSSSSSSSSSPSSTRKNSRGEVGTLGLWIWVIVGVGILAVLAGASALTVRILREQRPPSPPLPPSWCKDVSGSGPWAFGRTLDLSVISRSRSLSFLGCHVAGSDYSSGVEDSKYISYGFDSQLDRLRGGGVGGGGPGAELSGSGVDVSSGGGGAGGGGTADRVAIVSLDSARGKAVDNRHAFSVDDNRRGKVIPIELYSEKIPPTGGVGGVGGGGGIGTFSYHELAHATNGFSPANQIGKGLSGPVFYAKLRGREVAIKRLKVSWGPKELRKEMKVLRKVHHKHLVELIGFCADSSLFLVFEYCHHGSLSGSLHSPAVHGVLDWPTRAQVALDAAQALLYIHDRVHPSYVHGDVRSANILLDRNLRGKVGDFGLNKLTTKDDLQRGRSSHTAGQLRTLSGRNLAYMAPEYLQEGHVSTSVDVYSLGVVLLELLTGRNAAAFTVEQGSSGMTLIESSCTSSDCSYSTFSYSQGADFASLPSLPAALVLLIKQMKSPKDVKAIADPRLSESGYPKEAALQLARLAVECVSDKPQKRPQMKRVVYVMEDILAMSRPRHQPSADTADPDPYHVAFPRP